jgi:pilus assembly protein CpaC
VLAGKILTKSDQDKVAKVMGAYGTVVMNMSSFDTSGMSHAYEQAILQEIGLENISARVMGDTVVLEGVVYSAADSKRAEQIAKLKIPNVINLLTVQDVMIETDVQFVQVTGDKNKDFGFNVLDSVDVTAQSGVSGGSGMGGKFPVTFGASGSAEAKLKALLGAGTGKIVASPHLSTKNGETGSFQSGATAYLNAPGAQGVGNLIQVDYGVILKVKPTLEGRDRVKNEVTIEVSTPTTTSGSQFTLLKYNTTCTSVCKVGESMIISGMTQTISAGNSSKTPLLGDVPLLELFFSNKTADKERHEFVIVVTPRPVFPMAATGPAFSEQHNELLQDKDKDKPLKN